MFTKLATLTGDRRRHGAPVNLTHSNDHRPDRRLAVTPERARRQVLMCRWRAEARTGRLECRWQIEPVAETPAEAPAPRWVKGDGPRGSVRLRSKQARPQRAA
jgi:hypothetical protein